MNEGLVLLLGWLGVVILMVSSYLVGLTVGKAATRDEEDEEDALPVVLTERESKWNARTEAMADDTGRKGTHGASDSRVYEGPGRSRNGWTAGVFLSSVRRGGLVGEERGERASVVRMPELRIRNDGISKGQMRSVQQIEADIEFVKRDIRECKRHGYNTAMAELDLEELIVERRKARRDKNEQSGW